MNEAHALHDEIMEVLIFRSVSPDEGEEGINTWLEEKADAYHRTFLVMIEEIPDLAVRWTQEPEAVLAYIAERLEV